MSEASQAYGVGFARIYDSQWSDFTRRMAPRIERFYDRVSRRSRNRRRLLDVCCGSGQLALYFVRHGFQVTGLDLSGPMLDRARKNLEGQPASSATFLQADAAQFQLDRSFGLVVSTYDSLNHLPDLENLRNCFTCVAAATIHGGYFVFDLNTRRGLKRWNGITVGETDDIFLVQRGIFDGESRARMLLTGFIREGSSFARFEESVYNTAFDLATVRELLTETGWASVYFARSDDLETPIAEPEDEDRVWVIAKR